MNRLWIATVVILLLFSTSCMQNCQRTIVDQVETMSCSESEAVSDEIMADLRNPENLGGNRPVLSVASARGESDNHDLRKYAAQGYSLWFEWEADSGGSYVASPATPGFGLVRDPSAGGTPMLKVLDLPFRSPAYFWYGRLEARDELDGLDARETEKEAFCLSFRVVDQVNPDWRTAVRCEIVAGSEALSCRFQRGDTKGTDDPADDFWTDPLVVDGTDAAFLCSPDDGAQGCYGSGVPSDLFGLVEDLQVRTHTGAVISVDQVTFIAGPGR